MSTTRKIPKKRDIKKYQDGKPPIFVIYFDGMNIFIRYFSVFYNVLFDQDNRDVGQIIHQLNFILSFIDKYESTFPNSCLYNLVIEHGRSKKHQYIRKEYKSNRDTDESLYQDLTEEEKIEMLNKKESFKQQKKRFTSIQKRLSFINTIETFYSEGDFVIRYVMEQYEKMFPNNQVFHIIVSNDNDLKQLQSDDLNYNVFIYDYKLGLLSKENLKEMNYDINRIIFEKQIKGDVSDNIVGIKNVGIKRQNEIIKDLKGLNQKMSYKSFEKYLKENIQNIRNRNLRKKMEENIDLVVENYRMVNLIDINNVIDFLSFDLINTVNKSVKEYVDLRKRKNYPLWKIKFLQKLKEEKILDLLNKNTLFDFEITKFKGGK